MPLTFFCTAWIDFIEGSSSIKENGHPTRLIKKHSPFSRLNSSEVMRLLLGKPIVELSSQVLYIPYLPPALRSTKVKWVADIEGNPNNHYYSDAIEKYFCHPRVSPLMVCSILNIPPIIQYRRPSGAISVIFGNILEGTTYTFIKTTNWLWHGVHFPVWLTGGVLLYALLLEKLPWNCESDVLADKGSYQERYMSSFPLEYSSVISSQRVANHIFSLEQTELFDKVCDSVTNRPLLPLKEIIMTHGAVEKLCGVRPWGVYL